MIRALPVGRSLVMVLSAAGAMLAPQLADNARASASTYIAIGDSYAWGYTTFASGTVSSNGDRGYVSRYADHLATLPINAGIRPTVVNVGLSGENSQSFFNTSVPRALNPTYTADISQSARLAQAITDATSPIRSISISLGGGDLISVATAPDFATITDSERFGRILGAMNNVTNSLLTILGDLRSRPQTAAADILVLGYFDPFPGFPSSPATPFSGFAIAQLNGVLNLVAQQAGARFINIAPAFAGREAELSHIADDAPLGVNIHPNVAGYEVIAQQMIPGPGTSAAMLALGLVATRRRRATV